MMKDFPLFRSSELPFRSIWALQEGIHITLCCSSYSEAPLDGLGCCTQGPLESFHLPEENCGGVQEIPHTSSLSRPLLPCQAVLIRVNP